MQGYRIARVIVLFTSAAALSGCEDGFTFQSPKKAPPSEETVPKAATGVVEVEAPEKLQLSGKGLWDGRPSLGGVWVAHADVSDPQRVLIRNTENNRAVEGALFRRERENPGPPIQVSADAAAAIGMLAGNPTELELIALRREKVEPPAPEPKPAEAATADAGAAATVAVAAAAIDRAESAPEAEATTRPAARPAALDRPYIQAGLFPAEDQAAAADTKLRAGGLAPVTLTQKSGDRTFWRVLVGPVPTAAERETLWKKVRSLGYEDAYYVGG